MIKIKCIINVGLFSKSLRIFFPDNLKSISAARETFFISSRCSNLFRDFVDATKFQWDN